MIWSYGQWKLRLQLLQLGCEEITKTAATWMWFSLRIIKNYSSKDPISRTPIKKININHHQTKKLSRQQATILFFRSIFVQPVVFFSVALSGAPPLHCSVTGKQNPEPWELVAACVAAMAGFICSSSSAKEGWKKNTKEVHLVESLESYNEKWWKMVLKLL